VQIQRVDHESRVYIDIESDHIPAEGGAPGEVGRQGSGPLDLGGDGSTHRPALLRRAGTTPRFPKEYQPLGLKNRVTRHRHRRSPFCRHSRIG